MIGAKKALRVGEGDVLILFLAKELNLSLFMAQILFKSMEGNSFTSTWGGAVK